MRDHYGRARRLLWLLVAGAAVGIVFVACRNQGRSPQPPAEERFPPPPYSETAFLNTGSDARHIGTAACAECHPGNAKSYRLTAHSRSLAEADPNAEPPDGSHYHKASGRSYRVYRRDNQLRHEEVVRTAEGREISRVDVPIRYRIGSGHFTRSYLVESDGFLHESPVTWYAAEKKWDMSPGYDSPDHWGFDRPVLVGCVACHAGRAEAVDGTLHRITFQEQVIGCENCHGPGSRHEALHRGGDSRPGGDDPTIVNPGKLPRPLVEAICSACHLSGPATVALRGRQPTDFRPGRPMTDYRTDYRFEGGDELMTVVGHVEQLRRSACYQQSENLTCLTCHDPHARETPADKTAFYRQRCLSCHTVQSCGLDQAQRLKNDATDNCVACHMPSGDTEVPHIAFTNHRIARRPAPRPADLGPGQALRPADASGRAPELVPTDDVSRLAPVDRRQNLGLAYHAASENPVYVRAGYAGTFRERARALLEAVAAEGLRDPETTTALAEVNLDRDRDTATAYARQALDAPDISALARTSALLVLIRSAMRAHDFDSASRRLKELVLLRRAWDDWYFLGECYLEQGQTSRALPALKQALAIRPDRYEIHIGLAEVYRRLGNMQLAEEHREKAQWLFRHRPDAPG
jgi:hypothetical protein